MTEISFTAADMRPLIPSETVKGTADAASITPGDWVYTKSDGDFALADANSATTVEAVGVVVAVEGGKASSAIGDVLTVVTRGRVAGYSSMTPGALGYVSADAGEMDDTAPTGAGTWTKVLGRAESATVFFVDIDSEAAASNED